MKSLITTIIALALAASAFAQEGKLAYVKGKTPEETRKLSVEASGLPTLSGKWHIIGPFDNDDQTGFDTRYPPEMEIDFKKEYPGKGGAKAAWKEIKLAAGAINSLAVFGAKNNSNACAYVYTEIEAKPDSAIDLSLGSDDTLTVWLNGRKLVEDNSYKPAGPDQHRLTLRLKPGKNELLMKICQGGGGWELYYNALLPAALEAELDKRIEKDFPGFVAQVKKEKKKSGPTRKATDAESKYWRIVTLPVPKDCVLEVGGVEMTPDGRLLVCTRRGEIWAVHNPLSEDMEKVRFQLYARGLHEALGLRVVNDREIVVAQRPELTRVRDTDGDGAADEFTTICDKWGVSGDYHEYAFLSPRGKDGSYTVTLNVGFGGGVDGGSTGKARYRGWAVRITPDGAMTPYAVGLRSPNGVGANVDGDLFYCDNQGEWVATCKMHHLRPGDFYGHPVGLRWLKGSPLEGKWPETTPNGLLYDGGKGQSGKTGMPPLNPPCIWFPYGKMSQSNSEPICDTTGGKFGPFSGQMLIGDQTKSNIMRVALEKVKGQYQGACFFFRSGFECGVNRLGWGADGSLFVGMTARGWGSVGPKQYGLQRLVWTGETPMEIHSMFLTSTGFELTFTKPLDAASADRLAAYSMQSYTYNYFSTYGSPEVDRKAVEVKSAKVSVDRKKVTLEVPGLAVGRVYELILDGVKAEGGEPVLHPQAYYTLNNLK